MLHHLQMKGVIMGALLLACSTAPAAPISPSQQSLADKFEGWFRQQVAAEKILGAAYAVVSKESVIRMGIAGFTDTSRKQRINTDTVFRLASVSKTFAAELTAQMVQEGSLSLDDSVTEYLPAFHIKGDASKIHIQNLLGQSTGLISHAYDNLIEEGVPAAEIQQRMAELTLTCIPGDCYTYQNSVFSLIQPVVEKVGANSYAKLLNQRIFKPLDMYTASVGFDAFMANRNRAQPHVMSKGKWKTVKVLPNYYNVAPAAGVNASIDDMSKWVMAQLGANPQVISPEVINMVVLPRVRTPQSLQHKDWNRILTDAHYGLGWRVFQLGDEHIAYHSGWVSGYRADVAWSASHNIGIVVLMNVESNNISSLTERFWELAFARVGPAAKSASTLGSSADPVGNTY